MVDQYILAHDAGTTGDKAVLLKQDGTLIESAYTPYPLEYPSAEWVVQDPEKIWQAVASSGREVITRAGIEPAAITGVGITAQMFNMLPVDKNIKPLVPMISWLDRRTIAQAETIKESGFSDLLFRETGNVPSAKDIVPKILWFKENYPDRWKQTYKILDCKEYIIFQLTGKIAIDWHGASVYFLFDPVKRLWSKAACQVLGIPEELLPEVYPPQKIIGKITSSAARATGLREGTPVVLGLGDVGAAQVGSGAIGAEEAHLCLGTASWVGLSSSRFIADQEKAFWALNHVMPDRWVIAGEMETGGGSLMWFRENFCQRGSHPESEKISYREISNMASAVGPGSDKLLFLPWLSGERTIMDHFARAGFVGLSMNHNRGHMARSVMEGVAFYLRWIIEELENKDLPITMMNTIGGGSTSPVWTQIIADVTGKKLQIVEDTQEVGAIGVALTTAAGLGLYSGIEEAAKLWVSYKHVVEPRWRIKETVYDSLFQEFKEIGYLLTPVFRRMNSHQG
jgi:xylulokinase